MPIRSTDRRGYAQAMFLVVLTLLTSLTMLVLTAVNTDLKSSHADVALAQARALAETGLEEFDSQLLQNTDTTLDRLLQNTDGTLLDSTANAGNTAALATMPTYHRWMTYQPAAGAGLTNRSAGATTGTAQVCQVGGKDDYTRDCFYVDVDRAPKTTTVAGQTATSDPLVTITVIARTRCAGSAATCTYAALAQRLRNRQLFDYLFYTQFDALDPTLYPLATTDGSLTQSQATTLCGNRYATRTLSAAAGDGPEITATGGVTAPRDPRCLEVTYQADPSRQTGDIIRGPVFTNDDRIVVCGTPQFTDPVTVAGDGVTDPTAAGGRTFWASAKDLQATAADTGCANSQPLNAAGTGAATGHPCQGTCTLRLPPSNLSAPAFQAATAPTYQVSPIAAGPVGITVNAPAAGAPTSTLTFTNAKDATGAPITTPRPLPANNLLYVNGDVQLGGTGGAPSVLGGKLNIFAAGTLTVTGDARYCARPSTTALCDVSSSGPITDAGFTGRLTTLNADSNDLLVLMAGGSIQLAQPPAMSTHRELDGLLVALGNAVSVQNWQTPQSWAGDPAADPVLHFFGAMAGKYQGVFGSYNAALGSITSGYHKDFYFDSRLRDNAISLPYYPLSPGEPNWVRVDTSDVPGQLTCRQAQAPGCP